MFDLVYVGNYRPQTGGAAISCHLLMVQLSRLGCRCRILASITDEAETETREFDASQPELEFTRFRVPFYFNEPYRRPPAEWEAATRVGVEHGLERMIARSRPDVLLLREGWIPYANGLAQRHRIPTLALVRGNPTAAILRGVYPAELVGDYLAELRKADRIVAVGRHFLPGLEALGIRNAECISNLVDLDSFTPLGRDRDLAAQLSVAPDDIVVLVAGHIKDIKRPFDVVRSAVGALRAEPRLLYVFVGDGEDRDEARSLAAKLGVEKRFRFERTVNHGLMPAYMNLADIVVLASEAEGLARVYLEAQACGKTLVCSGIPAAREVIVDGLSGLLFRKGDVADLTAKTLRAAGDATLREQIGKAARERVQTYASQRIAKSYLRVVEELTAPPERRAEGLG